MMESFWVVIPAAGAGKRFGGPVAKPYLKYQGRTFIECVLSVFLSITEISGVVVALHEKDTQFQALPVAQDPRVTTVTGGVERGESVLLGLNALKEKASEKDWVLVHDAARPFLKAASVSRLIQVLQDHPVGGILALPVADTLKRVNEQEEITETVPRENLWGAQTPQMFRYAILSQALKKSCNEKWTVTDEAQAVARLDYSVRVVEGDPDNRKVTYPEDWSVV